MDKIIIKMRNFGIHSRFIKYIFNPIYWKYYRKSNRFLYYQKMKKLEFNSIESNLKLQAQKLFNLITYVDENIPYYSEIIKKKKIIYSLDSIFEDIKKFPILTKEDIRVNYHKLINKKINRKYFQNTSGGSTGEPVKFLQDSVMDDFNFAGKIFFNSWAGREEGDLMIKLWGSERDIIEGGEGIKGFLTEKLTNVKVLNSFRMNNKTLNNYVKIINKKKPKVILAYVQSIYELAKFVKNNKLKIHSPKGIIVSAGNLYPDFKKLILEVFNCKIYNRYGSREVGDIACNCNNDEGLHINIFNNYLEVLDKNLGQCNNDEMGNIFITNLNNYVMPLIRYDIGDIGIYTTSKCSCGRGLPLIKNIVGRDVNLFKLEDGTLIDGEYFTHLFYFRKWVKEFQIIQKNFDLIEINLVLNEGNKLDSFDKLEIEKNIFLVMGKKCKIKWNFSDKIMPTKSGKFLYTISEVK